MREGWKKLGEPDALEKLRELEKRRGRRWRS
jgi:hypothetical protein